MSDIGIHTSVNGVTCHACGDFIRSGKEYYKEITQGYQYPSYKNFCMTCAKLNFAKSARNIIKIYKKSRRLQQKYKQEDKTICFKCKNKYKNVVGECSPIKAGCKFKPLKRKNENKNSPKV